MFFTVRSVFTCTITALTILIISGVDSNLFPAKPIPTAALKKHCDKLAAQYYKYRDKAKAPHQKWKRTRKQADYDRYYNWKREAIYYKNRYNTECKKKPQPVPSPGQLHSEGQRYCQELHLVRLDMVQRYGQT